MMEYEYREWLVSQACDLCSEYGSYYELFTYLYSREFVPSLGRDADRAYDGISLRVNFINEEGYDIQPEDFGSCRVLELIVALALRCEGFLEEQDDHTGRWIHDMLVSLEVDELTDGYFDEWQACESVDILLSRRYNRNGRGGLFTVKKRNTDMRKIEIWYQMCWYLDEVMDS